MEKSKKIAFIYMGRTGGGAVYSYEMAKGLISNGAKLYIFISKYIENYEKWLDLDAVCLESVPTYTNKINFVLNTLKFRLFTYQKIKKKFKNVKVDACYLSMAKEHPWDRYFVNMFGKVQQIATIHDPIAHSSNKINGKLLSIASAILNLGIKDRKPDDIVILSKCFVEHIQKSFKLNLANIHVIPHGIIDYYNESEHNKIQHIYDDSKINFLFFGRIEKYKGLDLLADAFRKISSSNSSFALTIAGNGDFSYYKNLYNGLPNVAIENRWIKDEEIASFFNPKSNVILVLPYLDATQSGPVLIAMSNKVPVIVSNAGGLIEQVEDKKTGFVFEKSNVDELVKTMLFVSSRNNSDVVENACRFVKTLTWEELCKKVLGVIK